MGQISSIEAQPIISDGLLSRPTVRINAGDTGGHLGVVKLAGGDAWGIEPAFSSANGFNWSRGFTPIGHRRMWRTCGSTYGHEHAAYDCWAWGNGWDGNKLRHTGRGRHQCSDSSTGCPESRCHPAAWPIAWFEGGIRVEASAFAGGAQTSPYSGLCRMGPWLENSTINLWDECTKIKYGGNVQIGYLLGRPEQKMKQ